MRSFIKNDWQKATSKKSKKYNPSREEINKAMSEYLERGGTITRLNPDLSDLIIYTESVDEVDSFLME